MHTKPYWFSLVSIYTIVTIIAWFTILSGGSWWSRGTNGSLSSFLARQSSSSRGSIISLIRTYVHTYQWVHIWGDVQLLLDLHFHLVLQMILGFPNCSIHYHYTLLIRASQYCYSLVHQQLQRVRVSHHYPKVTLQKQWICNTQYIQCTKMKK